MPRAASERRPIPAARLAMFHVEHCKPTAPRELQCSTWNMFVTDFTIIDPAKSHEPGEIARDTAGPA